MSRSIPRRTFLRGVGTALALPMLEAMLPSSVLAAPALVKRPVRLGFMFVPNGIHMEDWTPKAEGADFELPYILEPLQDLREHLTVLTGLTHDKARANGDGPGDHARSAAAFLTGSQPRKTHGADIKVGISVDQYASQQIGQKTRFGSLELGLERGGQAGNCDSGYSCAYSSNISWRSENTPVPKEVDPGLVFDRLFATGDAKERAESRARRDRYRLSVLDSVQDDAQRLKSQLGMKDQQKLDEYFTSVRELERRVTFAGSGVDAPEGAVRPGGIPGAYHEHARLMLDMLALAFQADLTRISTFMFANEGSNRPYKDIEITDGHHDLSHHGGDPEKHDKIRRINRHHMEQFAYFLKKLDSLKEADGSSVLENSLIVYGCAISDGNRHNHDDLPVLLLGKGGGTITAGRHVRYPKETPMNNLYLSLLDRMEVPIDSLGDSTGRLPGLTA
jgi:hypothetical protein